jgi:hypothetical protein
MERKKGMGVEEKGNHWIKSYQFALDNLERAYYGVVNTVRGETVADASTP